MTKAQYVIEYKILVFPQIRIEYVRTTKAFTALFAATAGGINQPTFLII